MRKIAHFPYPRPHRTTQYKEPERDRHPARSAARTARRNPGRAHGRPPTQPGERQTNRNRRHDPRIPPNRPERTQQLRRRTAGGASRRIRDRRGPAHDLQRWRARTLGGAERRQQHPLHARLRRTAADARRPADHAPRRRGRHGPRAGRCGRRVGRPRGMGRGTRPVGNRKPFAHTRQGGRGPGAEHRRLRLRSQRRDRAGAHVLHRQPLGNGHRRRTLLLRLPRKHLQARTAGARHHHGRGHPAFAHAAAAAGLR